MIAISCAVPIIHHVWRGSRSVQLLKYSVCRQVLPASTSCISPTSLLHKSNAVISPSAHSRFVKISCACFDDHALLKSWLEYFAFTEIVLAHAGYRNMAQPQHSFANFAEECRFSHAATQFWRWISTLPLRLNLTQYLQSPRGRIHGHDVLFLVFSSTSEYCRENDGGTWTMDVLSDRTWYSIHELVMTSSPFVDITY